MDETKRDEFIAAMQATRKAMAGAIAKRDSDAKAQAEQEAKRIALMFWPADKPLPQRYVKTPPVPCAECRRIRLDCGARAVVVKAITSKAYLRCRSCGYEWGMPLAKV